MTRLGKIVLALVVLGAIAFAAMVRFGGSGGGPHRVVLDRPMTPGEIAIPVQGVAAATLTGSFGDPRDGGARRHEGIDIPAVRGTPVLAAADGVVEKLFTSERGGLTLYERSPDGGAVFYYAHLDRYAPRIAEGLPVRAGQVLGAVGASGDADEAAPHLHFEVHRTAPGERWWQGAAVDPYPLLRGAAGR